MIMRFAFACIALFLFAYQVEGAQKTVGFLVGAGGLGDESYNDMTLSGLVEAKRKLGFAFKHVVCDETPAGIREALDSLIAQNADVIVMNRMAYPEIVYDYTRRNPDMYFIVNDMPWVGHPNMVCMGYAHHEGAFLVGALAGWMTEAGKVGFVGGNDLPVIRSFRYAYREGVQYADAKVSVFEELVAEGRDTSGFDNPKKGFELAAALYKKDVDIIFAAAGLSGNGVIAAAKIHGKYAIGVDTDQDHMAKGHVLTSMMKRLDKATYNEVTAVLEGRFEPGVKYYGLKEGGVGLSSMKYTKHLIPASVIDRLEETKQRIIEGKIDITAFDYLGAQITDKSEQK